MASVTLFAMTARKNASPYGAEPFETALSWASKACVMAAKVSPMTLSSPLPP